MDKSWSGILVLKSFAHKRRMFQPKPLQRGSSLRVADLRRGLTCTWRFQDPGSSELLFFCYAVDYAWVGMLIRDVCVDK